MGLFSNWLKPKNDPDCTSVPPPQPLTLASSIPQRLLPLWQLFRERQLVEVRWNHSQRSYQTLIVALDLTRNRLWLDDLVPAQRQLDLHDTITLHHSEGEYALTFSGAVVEFAENFGASGFAISLPYEVAYQSRRRHPRVSLEGREPRFATLRSRGGEEQLGVIQDISVGGLRVQLGGNQAANFRPGMALAHLDFQLGERSLNEAARVCGVRFIKNPQRVTQVSLCFADTSASAQAKRQHELHSLLSNHAYFAPARGILTAAAVPI